MRKLLALAILSVLSVGFSGSQAPHADRYLDLVQRLKSGDRMVDFTEFRMAFVNSPEFRGPDSQLQERIKAAAGAHRYEEVLSIAAKMLAENYTDALAHFHAYRAHKELGHKDEAAYHHFILEGLASSIEKSGDGKSKASAYVVISTGEVLLPLFREQVKEQSPFEIELTQEGIHRWCTFTGVDARTNQRFTLFFNVDIPVSRVRDTLLKKKAVGATK